MKTRVLALVLSVVVGGIAHAQTFSLPPLNLPLPLKSHTQRFLDSTGTRDYQCCPIRTYRAYEHAPIYSPANNRVYMMMGSAAFGYDAATLFTGGRPLNQVQGRINGAEGELYLEPQASFYAENEPSWPTPTLQDGQYRLGQIDVDDRGYVYLAYTIWGWGLAQDTGTSMRFIVESSTFMSGNQGCDQDDCISSSAIIALKANGRYYSVVGGGGVWAIWDVTTPSSPSYLYAMKTTERLFRSDSGDWVASADGSGTVRIRTASQLIAGSSGTSYTLSSKPIYIGAADGDTFWFSEYSSKTSFNIFKVVASTGQVTTYPVTMAEPLSAIRMNAGADFVVITDASKTRQRVFQATSTELTELTGVESHILDYYRTAPGYAKPTGILPLKYNGKTYFVWALHGVGDVYEVQAGDSISISVKTSAGFGTKNPNSPTRNDGPFYGDLVTFSSTFNGENPPSTLAWDFDNPESTDNTDTAAPAVDVTHRYSELSTAGQIAAAKAAHAEATSNSEIFDDVSVDVMVPTARVLVPGILDTTETGGDVGTLVLGDTFKDASDGSVESHYAGWTLDGGSVANLVPTAGFDAGACGARTLSFAANYRRYTLSGDVANPSSEAVYTSSITGLTYTVKPFDASAEISGTNSTQVTFANTTRAGSSASFIGGAQWTETWELIDGAGDPIVAATVNALSIGSTTSYVVDKSSIPASGGKVRLTLTIAADQMVATGCESYLTATVEFPLEKPDPAISTANCTDPTTLAGSCELSVFSILGSSTGSWTYEWYLEGQLRSTQATYEPSFNTTGNHDVYVVATNPFGSTQSSTVVLDVKQPPCNGEPYRYLL